MRIHKGLWVLLVVGVLLVLLLLLM
jgi:hypothetical protein